MTGIAPRPADGIKAMAQRRQSITQIRARAAAGEFSWWQLERLQRDPRVGVRRLALTALRRAKRQAAEKSRVEAMLVMEKRLWAKGCELVAGLDEVGVGPLAGPVYAAAVVLKPGTSIAGINDSKRLSHRQRVALDAHIREVAIDFALGSCSPQEIDRMNIYQASREAMRRAVAGLRVQPEHLLVDARQVPGVTVPQTSIVKGDSCSQSIAAASIVAKVERDTLMEELGLVYPGYGLEKHRGYPTAEHVEALRRLGATSIHRRSFAPVRDLEVGSS